MWRDIVQVVSVQESNIQQLILTARWMLIWPNAQRRVHIKFILFSHLFRLCKHRHPKNSIRMMARKRVFPLNYLSSWILGAWTGPWAWWWWWWWWWNIYEQKIFCIMNSKYISLPLFTYFPRLRCDSCYGKNVTCHKSSKNIIKMWNL